MKILLTGATGLLGEHLIKSKPGKYTIVGTYHKISPRIKKNNVSYKKLDITNFSDISTLIEEVNPEVILHTASLGNVDYCQQHQEEARKINIDASLRLFSSAHTAKSKFVFFSTNAIYDGKNAPYDENSSTKPLDFYGKTKLEVEKKLEKFMEIDDILIVRLMTMYGWNNPKERTNPVTWFLQRLRSGNKLYVVDDVYNNYLYAKDAAEGIWKLVEAKTCGKINMSGLETISRYELALKTAAVFELDKRLIKPVESSFFPHLAKRPKFNAFNIKKIKRLISFKPLSIDEGLLDMKSLEKYE